MGRGALPFQSPKPTQQMHTIQIINYFISSRSNFSFQICLSRAERGTLHLTENRRGHPAADEAHLHLLGGRRGANQLRRRHFGGRGEKYVCFLKIIALSCTFALYRILVVGAFGGSARRAFGMHFSARDLPIFESRSVYSSLKREPCAISIMQRYYR